jgi:hypothetical protein
MKRKKNLATVAILLTAVAIASVVIYDFASNNLAYDKRGMANGLAIDGSAKNFCDECSSVSVVLSTKRSNDLIYVVTYDSNIGRDEESVSSSPQLIWKNRISVSTPNDMDTWYAVWRSSGNLTIVLSTGSQVNANDVIIGFAISGANLTEPFDPNPSIVSVAKCENSCGTSQHVTISTSNSNDMIIGAINAAGGGAMSAGTCCTHINGLSAGDVEYVKETSVQASLTLSYSSQLAPTRWIFIADAIEAGG